MRIVPTLALLAALSVTVPGGQIALEAQAPQTRERTVRVRTEGRWLPEGAHPAAIRFGTGQADLEVSATRSGSRRAMGTLELKTGKTELRLTVDGGNRLEFITVRPSWSYSTHDPDEERGLARGLRFGAGGAHLLFATPSSMGWEVPVPLPGRPLSDGMTWSDSLRFVAQPVEAFRDEMVGRWDFRVVGDSVVDGERFPRIQMEASLHVRTDRPVEDGARRAPMVEVREATGRLKGWMVLDTVMGIRVAGADTLTLEGAATLTLEDGRHFTTPGSFVQYRTWSLPDSARDAARAQEFARSRGGMLIPPGPEGAAVDSAAVDSLWNALGAATTPEGRLRIRRRIESGASLNWTQMNEAMAHRLLETGDTLPFLDLIDGGARFPHSGSPRFDRGTWEAYRPFLEDPGRLWRLGLTPRWIHSGLAQGLLRASPVSGEPEDRWICPPAFCETLLSEMEGSPEARVRELAVIGRFARDPAAHWDEVLALQAEGSTLVDEAVQVGRGVGATWPAAPKTPVPEAGAPWRAWRDWMGGSVRFEASHRLALRFYRARTGRDPVDDLEERWPGLTGDSARMVVNALLRAEGRLPPPSPDQLRDDLLSGSEARVAMAMRDLPRMQGTSRVLAGGEALDFLAPLLDSMLVRGTLPWPAVAGGHRGFRPGQGFHGAWDVPVFLFRDEVPAGLFQGRDVEPTDREEWRARDLREGGVLVELSPVRRIGDLVLLEWSWTAWFPRPADHAAEGYAGGARVWLVWTGEGWVAATYGGWIT